MKRELGRIAYIWWCGDDWCDCTQPVVENVQPNLKGGIPGVVTRERVWSGTFHSAASAEESKKQRHELEIAAKEHNAKLLDN